MELPFHIAPVSWRRYLGIFPQISYLIVGPAVNVLTSIVTTFLRSSKVRSFDLPACPLAPDADLLPGLVATEPSPDVDTPYPLDSWLLPDDAPVAEQTAKPHQGSFLLAAEAEALRVQPGLAVALDNINKAIILQKIYEWMLHNESINRNLIDGDHYTYNSAAQWQQKHFPWLAASTVKRLIQELETDGYIVSQQPLAHLNDFRKWLTIPATTRVLIETLIVENSPAQKNPGGYQKNPPAESFAPGASQKTPHTTSESQSRRRQSQNRKAPQQQQPNEPDVETEIDDVVVEETDNLDQESITGEHPIEGEGEQQPPRGAARGSAIVEAMHREHSNDTPISPSSATPPLSPEAADVLRADLIRFGVVPDAVNRLVQTYSEADIRYVLKRAQAAQNLHTPAGFLIRELAKGDTGVLGLRGQGPETYRLSDMVSASADWLLDDLAARAAEADLGNNDYLDDPEPLPPAEDHIWPQFVALCADVPELASITPSRMHRDKDGRVTQYDLVDLDESGRQAIRKNYMMLCKRLETLTGCGVHIFVPTASRPVAAT